MSSSESAAPSGTNGTTTALKHDEAHQPIIEDVPDEDELRHGPAPVSSSILESTDESESSGLPGWVASMSAKAAGKQKEEPKASKPALDTQSEEFFPSLGGGPKPVMNQSSMPKWGASKPNGASNGVPTNGNSGPNSGTATPTSSKPTSKVPQSLAGQGAPLYTLQPREVLSRKELKRPIPEVLKEINKKTRANLSMTTGEGGVLKFSASGPVSDAVKHQAFRDLGAQICAKSKLEHPVPRSSKAHIIGKAGSNIKAIQEATGARIQLPKDDGVRVADDDDDEDILVTIEGTPFAIALAKASINKTLNERSSTVNSKVKNIPAEFFPFISGGNNAKVNALEETHGVQIRVPPYHTWTSQAPPQPSQGKPLVFQPATSDSFISIAGDRAAVQAARSEIEQFAQQLRQQLILEQFYLTKGRHQYIIGNRGIPAQEFFAKTGCAIILPGGDEDEISVIGSSPEEVQAAIDHAMELAASMQSSSFDISRAHRNAADPRLHARNVTQYLRSRKEIDRIEKLHETHIVTPINSKGADPWELFYRHGPNSIKAQSEIAGIVNAHPPSRFASVQVDPFYNLFIEKHITPVVQKDYGVHVVVPANNETGAPVLLIFEGEEGENDDYKVPRGAPSAQEVNEFKKGLEDARKHILEIINAQAEITSTSIDVPKVFHEKLRKFIQKEQQQRAADQIPVRVSAAGTVVTLRGPAPAVESLADKVNAFIAEATEDEKERGFSLTFDYPQKHANQLIGKGGSNINELREKFDVDITVDDGKVTLKGPKAKAEAAKTHITALGKQWADEATHVLKIDPKFHGELIGGSGVQINRLQDRYKVQIHFPRSAKPSRDDHSNDAASESGKKGPRREQAPDEVIVKGPKKGADSARDELLELLQYSRDNSNVATVSVQAGQIPSLIGQRGSGMDEIRAASKAKIDIPNARDAPDPTTRVEIQIKGTKAQIALAKKMIEEKRDVFDQTVTKTLAVDKKHHRALIGKEGSILRDIVVQAGGSDDRRDLARTVQFPKAETDGNLIKVEGKADLVDKIIASMEKIVAELSSQTSETIEVPTNKHRTLIGRGGEAKRDIEKKFNVFIDIPRQGSEQTGVKIAGQPADVENAKSHIEGLVKEQAGETVQVPRNIHHSISDNGQFFRKLRNDHGVSVDHAGEKLPPKPTSNVRGGNAALPLITDDEEASSDVHSWKVVNSAASDLEGEIPWVLRGPVDNMAKAKAVLAAAIKQAQQNTSTGYLILPDPRTYRHVIGQGGSKVNSIRKASGCKITVPKNQAENEAIEVVGSAEGVEKAKDLILQAVKEGANGGGPRNGGGEKWNNDAKGGNGNWD